MNKAARKRQRNLRAFLIIVGMITILAAIYFGFVVYFQSHYYWNTTIGSYDCGGKTPEDSIAHSRKMVGDYILGVNDRQGNTFAVMGEDIDYEYVPVGEEEAILTGQNPFDWYKEVWKEHTYELPVSISYNEEKVRTVVSGLKLFSDDYYEIPVNADLQLTEEGYEVIPEQEGSEPKFEPIFEEVKSGLDLQTDSITLSDACYVRPQRLSDDPTIVSITDKLDAIMQTVITYEIGEDRIELTGAKLMSFFHLVGEYEIEYNDEAILSFVQTLCDKYNTYGDVREFTTHAGDVIKIGGGDYGWVISKQGEINQIKADMEAGKSLTREPVYEQTAVKHGAIDFGNTYIEIDYTAQHIWYYEDGVVVLESDIVSGNLSHSNGSVDGVYSISYKKKDATLVGEDYSSNVNYFMPFAYNIGIHDAGWRSSFGGDIYLTSGSHGCINVPFSFAEPLFNRVALETPVIAYYRTEVVLTNNAAKVSNAYSYRAPETTE